MGHAVTIIDDLSTGRFENIEPFLDHEHFTFAIDTITNEGVLDRLVSRADAMFHLAAAVGVQLIIERPVHTIETNVMGTDAVLRAARRYRVKTVLASSSEVYGKGTNLPFSEEEDSVLGPSSKSRWGYAASKLVDEFLGLAYHSEYGLPVVVARFFNTVGPGQTGQYGMVIPRFVAQALDGRPLSVYGDGEQSRAFCDVRDVTRALVALEAHPEAVGRVFNIGSGREITINELAKMVLRVCGSSAAIKHRPYEEVYPPGFEDMQRRLPSTDRIGELVGWEPEIALEDTIAAIRDQQLNSETR